ncbi:DinB family protein [Leadbetterella sp. DM7]|uniref:DinB family protein n=1 Tax=Leadbetterella sp. DM7 TaxID=3235085 RepID=UPI00349EB06F
MVETTLSRIIDNIDTVFRGDAWHGPSVMEMINSLPESKLRENQPFSRQSIAQNIYHLTAYRNFVIEKLKDNIHFRLETDEENWGTEEALKDPVQLKKNLVETHNRLLTKLEEFDDELLSKNVPGEYYDFYKLLNGLIQHDTYHLGMIWVLWQ